MYLILLEEAKKIKLFNRIETKYESELNSKNLENLLKYLYDNYYVVANNNITIFEYINIYFDSDDLIMYNEHKKNSSNRQKVRIREYSNGNKYLEIKHKIDHKTIKKRIPIDNVDIDNNFDWIKDNLQYDISKLSHILTTKYDRITFISKDFHERITVDFNIEFFNLKTKITKLINKVIIEVKQDDKSSNDIHDIIKSFNIEKCHFSKYFNGLNYTI